MTMHHRTEARRRLSAARYAERRLREQRARRALIAIREMHPEDARQILVAVLDQMTNGAPEIPLYSDTREDARYWSRAATPHELEAYLAAILDTLGQTALHDSRRKRLFAKLWNGFDADTRAAFLAKVEGGADAR